MKNKALVIHRKNLEKNKIYLYEFIIFNYFSTYDYS